MLRLPDPEMHEVSAPVPLRVAGASSTEVDIAAGEVPSVDMPGDDALPGGDALEGDGHRARNPLFRAIEGGAAASPDEPRPPRRDPAGTIRARRKATRRVPAAETTAVRGPREPGQREPGSGFSTGAAAGGSGRTQPECYACPVGVAFSTVRGAGPETMDHLMAASRELVAAARSVIEVLENGLDRRSAQRGRVARIPLED